MTKYHCSILIALITFSFAGCGSGGSKGEEESTKKKETVKKVQTKKEEAITYPEPETCEFCGRSREISVIAREAHELRNSGNQKAGDSLQTIANRLSDSLAAEFRTHNLTWGTICNDCFASLGLEGKQSSTAVYKWKVWNETLQQIEEMNDAETQDLIVAVKAELNVISEELTGRPLSDLSEYERLSISQFAKDHDREHRKVLKEAISEVFSSEAYQKIQRALNSEE